MDKIKNALTALQDARDAWANAPDWAKGMAKSWAGPLMAALDELEVILRQMEKLGGIITQDQLEEAGSLILDGLGWDKEKLQEIIGGEG